MVIVNKNPHFKKVPLLILQFPSALTLNNWFFHLLNLYSFVTYFYSSSIHFFCVFSSSSSFSFFFFFLSQGHMKQKNGSRCSFRRLFWLESVVSAGFGGRIDMFRWPFWFPFLSKSAHFGPNRRKSSWIKKKTKGEMVCRMPEAASDSDAVTLEPCWCFLVDYPYCRLDCTFGILFSGALFENKKVIWSCFIVWKVC